MCRTTDLPWSGISSIVVALSNPASLSPSDVTLNGSNGVDYMPVSISSSGSSYTINLDRPITQAERLTVAIGNFAIAPFVKDLRILPGDINDDGRVDSADLLVVSRNFEKTGTLLEGDLNADGQVDFADMVIVAQHYGSALPPNTPKTGAVSFSQTSPAPLTVFAASSGTSKDTTSKFSTTRVKPVSVSLPASKRKLAARRSSR